jgi:hypothetical protein
MSPTLVVPCSPLPSLIVLILPPCCHRTPAAFSSIVAKAFVTSISSSCLLCSTVSCLLACPCRHLLLHPLALWLGFVSQCTYCHCCVILQWRPPSPVALASTPIKSSPDPSHGLDCRSHPYPLKLHTISLLPLPHLPAPVGCCVMPLINQLRFIVASNIPLSIRPP